MTFNPSDIKFEEPVCHPILSLGRHYYTQALKCKGNDLLLTSECFLSHGVSCNHMDNKPEIKVKNCQGIVNVLHAIEETAMKQLKLPSEYQHTGAIQPIFKRLPTSSNLFFKLSHDAVFFDKNKNMIQPVNAGYGNYRVILKVVGIYIGPHGNTEKLASLQVRIIQLQYDNANPQCFFDLMVPIPKPQSTLPTEVNFPQIDQTAQAKQATKREEGDRNFLDLVR